MQQTGQMEQVRAKNKTGFHPLKHFFANLIHKIAIIFYNWVDL